MTLSKTDRRRRIKLRIRKSLVGTDQRPRLAIFRSNKQIYVQAIDDVNGKTIISASSKEKTVAEKTDVKKIEQAGLVGKLIAEKCKSAGIENVIFDRGGYKYHGRVKSLADAARKGGLKF